MNDVGGCKQTISYFGHIYSGKTQNGYAVCDACGAIENSDKAAKLCSRFLKNCTLVNDKYLEQLQAENKKLKGRIINLEKDRIGYKRDSEKYLKMLEDKKICPDCGTVDAVCDCPFG